MEIRRWHLYIVIGCVLITHFEAKTVSLNELIAAESKQKPEKVPRTKSASTPSTSKPCSQKEAFPAESQQKVERKRLHKISDFEAKTVSLNELIAAESKQKPEKVPRTKSASTPSTSKPCSQKEAFPAESQQKVERKRLHKISGKSPRRQSFSLKDLFAAEARETRRKIESFLSRTRGGGLLSNRRSLLPPLSFHNIESTESLFSRARTLSPLNFRKIFEIKSPLRPKRLKHSFNPRYGRQKQTIKRQIFENGQIIQKEIPIIKRIGLLVDGIISSGSRESYEVKRLQRRRKKSKNSGDRREPKCNCDAKPDLESAESKPDKKAVIVASTVSPEVTTVAADTPTEASSATTHNTTPGDVYTVRPDPNLSLLFTRNSTSRRRDYYGFSERSSPTLHRDLERNITRNNGNNEHNSGGERYEACSPDNEENPCGSARNDASGTGSVDGLHRDGINPRHPDHRDETKKTKISSDVDGFVRRDGDEHEKENKFQVGRKAEETIQIPRSVQRLRGTIPEHQVVIDAESVQPKETRKESVFNVAYDLAGPERIAQWNGAAATENQRLRSTVETVTPMNSLSPNFMELNSQPNQIVTIFDGYSVARDINGRNRLSEKSIHISSE